MPKELIKPAECTFELPQAAVRLMGGDGCLGGIGLRELLRKSFLAWEIEDS